MARLQGIRIKNFRALADVAVGQVKYASGDTLPGMACFIGPNGSGKSSLMDVFGFISQCLSDGVEAACDHPARGGFDRLRTQGCAGPVEFELFFDAGDAERPIVYALAIDQVSGVPAVLRESLRQRRRGETRGKPYYFLKLEKGKGKVWAGAYDVSIDSKKAERVKLADATQLGIATLGNLDKHPRIVTVREYIEEWYLSYFVPDAARELQATGAQRWLDRRGSNVGNVLQYYQRQYPKQFGQILKDVARAIPGLKKIEPKPSEDNRLLIRFDEAGYKDPFYQQSMSDGTLKMLAYAVLLADPKPRPFIGIEEPENGLYVQLIEQLARRLVAHAEDKKTRTQVLVTTHSPYFVDALKPEQVWLIEKGPDGCARVTRTTEFQAVREMVDQGIPLGSLWYSRHFGGLASS
ncbi:MAG: AAA family ATPase [Polyangiaceae bacterium]|nr:AAA family ATPase [Polyangiaceae bacterium]